MEKMAMAKRTTNPEQQAETPPEEQASQEVPVAGEVSAEAPPAEEPKKKSAKYDPETQVVLPKADFEAMIAALMQGRPDMYLRNALVSKVGKWFGCPDYYTAQKLCSDMLHAHTKRMAS